MCGERARREVQERVLAGGCGAAAKGPGPGEAIYIGYGRGTMKLDQSCAKESFGADQRVGCLPDMDSVRIGF